MQVEPDVYLWRFLDAGHAVISVPSLGWDWWFARIRPDMTWHASRARLRDSGRGFRVRTAHGSSETLEAALDDCEAQLRAKLGLPDSVILFRGDPLTP